MKVLVACEESQVVCQAFRDMGHEAYSCDILPCSGGHPEWHIQDDVLNVIYGNTYPKFNMMIAHVPCTYISSVGNRWFKTDPSRYIKRLDAIIFWLKVWYCDIPKVCIENPIGYMNTHWKKATHIIHPYYFGDPELKRTCLWTRGLSPLEFDKDQYPKPEPMYICQGEKCKGKKIYRTEGLRQCGSAAMRQIARSKTFPGIARAMAEQWGGESLRSSSSSGVRR